jgi:asparagine synthase (glutamine-hydrolysing)
MCGITGYIDFSKKSSKEILEKMVNALKHRGPDDQGIKIYEDDLAQIGFGQSRLAIIDLSAAGHQPMFLNQFAIVLNGEIYNYKEIKADLIKIGHQFVSESDTEVVLHAFQEWGINCVHQFIGMFAFVIYDTKLNKLYLCRDRAGVKPLFYYWKNGLFLFASELKAMHQHPCFEAEISKEALSLYLQYGYIQGPLSIFDHCFKMEPGTWKIIDIKKRTFEKQRYWDVRKVYEQPIYKMDYEEAKTQTEELLKSACNYRMVADVPVGIFLSGGYDSTAVTAILQQSSKEKLNTFTIGFPQGADEAPFAEQVASVLGTNHTTYNCTHEDAKAIIPDLAFYYDEPCSDISTIPTLLVSKIAREHVTVALSADGGDEVFAGYSGYSQILERLQTLQRVPGFAESGVAFMSKRIANVLPDFGVELRHKLSGIAKILDTSKGQRIARMVENSSKMPDDVVSKLINQEALSKNPIYYEDFSRVNTENANILLLDYLTTLPDLLLVKVDRASMATSLESREPLLDHRLLEFAARLPMSFKLDGKNGKRILKDIVHKYVDKDIMDRPKMGFDLPIYKWLREDLSYLIDEFLSPKCVKEYGCFNAEQVSKIVTSFRAGTLRYESIIWRLIHFQMWYKRWMTKQ